MPPIRGINGWLKSCGLLHEGSLRFFGGSTMGIDAIRFFTALLLKDPWAEAIGHTDTAAISVLVAEQLSLFADADITPVFVFPGVTSLPRLAPDTNANAHVCAGSSGSSAASTAAVAAAPAVAAATAAVSVDSSLSWALTDPHAASRDNGWESVRGDALTTAEGYFAEITPSLSAAARAALLATLRAHGAQVLTAPHRVAAQLAWLDHEPQKATHSSYGLHELLLHRVATVVTAVDLARGTATWVSLSQLLAHTKLTHTQFVHACLLAGHGPCRTFPAVYDERGRFNFARAITLVRAAKGSLTQVCLRPQ